MLCLFRKVVESSFKTRLLCLAYFVACTSLLNPQSAMKSNGISLLAFALLGLLFSANVANG
jgi:hypothetical protein